MLHFYTYWKCQKTKREFTSFSTLNSDINSWDKNSTSILEINQEHILLKLISWYLCTLLNFHRTEFAILF